MLWKVRVVEDCGNTAHFARGFLAADLIRPKTEICERSHANTDVKMHLPCPFVILVNTLKNHMRSLLVKANFVETECLITFCYVS